MEVTYTVRLKFDEITGDQKEALERCLQENNETLEQGFARGMRDLLLEDVAEDEIQEITVEIKEEK